MRQRIRLDVRIWWRVLTVSGALLAATAVSFGRAPIANAGGPYDDAYFAWDSPTSTTGHGYWYWYSGDCGGCIAGSGPSGTPSRSLSAGSSPVTAISVDGWSINDAGDIAIDGTLIAHKDVTGGRDRCEQHPTSYGGPSGSLGTTISISTVIYDTCGHGYGLNLNFTAYRVPPPSNFSLSPLTASAPTTVCSVDETSLGLPTVNLSWSAASGASRYDVYENGHYVGSTTSTSFARLTAPSTAERYFIRAWNSNGSLFTDSTTQSVTTPPCLPTLLGRISPATATVPLGGSAVFSVSATADSKQLLP